MLFHGVPGPQLASPLHLLGTWAGLQIGLLMCCFPDGVPASGAEILISSVTRG